MMNLVLVYTAVLVAFSAVLLTKDNLKAIWASALGIGVCYTVWGFYQTSGVPDDQVTDVAMDYIRYGLGLVVFGLIISGVWFFIDIRRRMPA